MPLKKAFHNGQYLESFEEAMVALAHGCTIGRGNYSYELTDDDNKEDFKDMIVSLQAAYEAGLIYEVEETEC